MVYPLLRTVVISFRNNSDTDWIGFANYQYFFTFPDTLTSLRNSLLWLVFYTFFAAFLGLIIAILVDRVKYEPLAKIPIFLPLPITPLPPPTICKFLSAPHPPPPPQPATPH